MASQSIQTSCLRSPHNLHSLYSLSSSSITTLTNAPSPHIDCSLSSKHRTQVKKCCNYPLILLIKVRSSREAAAIRTLLALPFPQIFCHHIRNPTLTHSPNSQSSPHRALPLGCENFVDCCLLGLNGGGFLAGMPPPRAPKLPLCGLMILISPLLTPLSRNISFPSPNTVSPAQVAAAGYLRL